MPKFLPVDGRPDLVRDVETGAIINRNRTDYEAHVAAENARLAQKDKINKLEADVAEIKEMLKLLINKE